MLHEVLLYIRVYAIWEKSRWVLIFSSLLSTVSIIGSVDIIHGSQSNVYCMNRAGLAQLYMWPPWLSSQLTLVITVDSSSLKMTSHNTYSAKPSVLPGEDCLLAAYAIGDRLWASYLIASVQEISMSAQLPFHTTRC